jgi:hypothetical protein
LDSSGPPSGDRDPSDFPLKVSATVGKSNDYRRVRAITPVVVGPQEPTFVGRDGITSEGWVFGLLPLGPRLELVRDGGENSVLSMWYWARVREAYDAVVACEQGFAGLP